MSLPQLILAYDKCPLLLVFATGSNGHSAWAIEIAKKCEMLRFLGYVCATVGSELLD